MGYSKRGFTIPLMSSIHSKDYRTMIGRLRKARVDAGLTQVDAAKALKKPQSFISKIENHQRRVDVLELKEFAKLYKVDIADLL